MPHHNPLPPKQPLRKTKIVATLGPTSADEKTLTHMLKAGINVARVNFSHGDHESNGALIDAVRAAAKKGRRPVAVLQDLCGPKIRIGDFTTETVTLTPRKTFTLTTKKIEGDRERVSINYAKLPAEVIPGAPILLNDGKVQLRVEKTTNTDIVCTVVIGGTIRGRRGVNAPGAALSISAITAKDKKDLAFGLEKGVNFVTLSFVRKAKEVYELRKLLGAKQDEIGIIAKIETKEAIDNLDAIIKAADGIMVARGDLAIEIPREEVPLVQKDIITKCNTLGKPVITATQMLDSMREQEVPTRAEVNDVANAILDGSDAVMLSDETTVGRFPAHAVETMAHIATTVEQSEHALGMHMQISCLSNTIADSVTTAIAREAQVVHATAIAAFTESGLTARLIARHRPQQPVVVLTPHEKTFYQALLVHGCYPVLVEPVGALREAIAAARAGLKKLKLGAKGDRFVLGAGMPFKQHGSTNMLVVERV